ncbi:hypothetical protein [Vibrio cortegadensis]|uniref:Uncharacterized protein n=1 Tax=Vibrio cortegadensis TaxID=1328770 RepID=A0ABV4M8Y1_9VIBR
MLDIVKQQLGRDKALLLAVHLDVFGLRIDIASDFKRQLLAQAIKVSIA